MLTVDHERPDGNGHAGSGGEFDVGERPDRPKIAEDNTSAGVSTAAIGIRRR